MATDLLRQSLGPLADLVGIWEGDKGNDIAPSDDRASETNLYRERIIFETMAPIQNHEQNLSVLRYSSRAWRLGEAESFHEELGYWSWEAETQQIMRSFLVPRGISLIAGGEVEPAAKTFTLYAAAGSSIFGICSNPFLDREFKILSFEVTVQLHDQSNFSYDQDTVIQLPGRREPFHHRDRNTLQKFL